MQLGRKEFNQRILTHDSKIWALTMQFVKKLRVIQKAMELRMIGITLKD